MSKREEKVEEQPKICPLLAIAMAQVRLATRKDFQCIQEKCAFYLEKLPPKVEKCIWVRIAITLGNIWATMERPRGTTLMERSMQRRMQNLKKQQSP